MIIKWSEGSVGGLLQQFCQPADWHASTYTDYLYCRSTPEGVCPAALKIVLDNIDLIRKFNREPAGAFARAGSWCYVFLFFMKQELNAAVLQFVLIGSVKGDNCPFAAHAYNCKP